MRSDSSQLPQGAVRQKAEHHRGTDDWAGRRAPAYQASRNRPWRLAQVHRAFWRPHNRSRQKSVPDRRRFCARKPHTPPTLLLRIRARVEVEVKPGENTEGGPRTTVVEDVVGRRDQSAGIIRRRAKKTYPP